MIKASQRLDSKPLYNLAEQIPSRKEKETKAFDNVIKLVDFHDEMDTGLARFQV